MLRVQAVEIFSAKVVELLTACIWKKRSKIISKLQVCGCCLSFTKIVFAFLFFFKTPHDELNSLLGKCWKTIPYLRPKIKSIKKQFDIIRQSTDSDLKVEPKRINGHDNELTGSVTSPKKGFQLKHVKAKILSVASKKLFDLSLRCISRL
jgi:hypothetical protein